MEQHVGREKTPGLPFPCSVEMGVKGECDKRWAEGQGRMWAWTIAFLPSFLEGVAGGNFVFGFSTPGLYFINCTKMC